MGTQTFDSTKRMNHIFIHDLMAYGIVGVYPHERLTPQKLILNIAIYFGEVPAQKSDRLIDAIDYSYVAEKLVSYIQETQHQLLEKLCQELISLSLGLDQRIQAVQISISKPQALPFATSVGVTLYQQRY